MVTPLFSQINLSFFIQSPFSQIFCFPGIKCIKKVFSALLNTVHYPCNTCSKIKEKGQVRKPFYAFSPCPYYLPKTRTRVCFIFSQLAHGLFLSIYLSFEVTTVWYTSLFHSTDESRSFSQC